MKCMQEMKNNAGCGKVGESAWPIMALRIFNERYCDFVNLTNSKQDFHDIDASPKACFLMVAHV